MDITIHLKIDKSDIMRAIEFINGPTHAEAAFNDYFQNDIFLDFNTIKDKQTKVYHRNGLVAILIMLQNEMEKGIIIAKK